MSKSVSDHNELFGELRSQLAQRPSADAWKALWRLTMRWPDDEVTREQLVPYGTAQLAAWPDALRVAPAGWGDLALRGQPPPALCWARVLVLDGRTISRKQAEALAAAPGLEHIRTLSLVKTELGARALPALLEADTLKGLRTLQLASGKISAADIYALAAWPGTGQLDQLNLSGISHLEAWRLLHGQLPRELSLSYAALDVQAARVLGQNQAAQRLERLYWLSGHAEAGSLMELATSAHLTNLKHLSLRSSHFGPAVSGDELVAMLASPALAALEEVQFMLHQPMTSAQISMLSASPTIGRFKLLGLNLDDAGIRQLLECDRLHPQARAALEAQLPSAHEDDEADSDGYEDDWE